MCHQATSTTYNRGSSSVPPFRALAPSECLRKVWQSHSLMTEKNRDDSFELRMETRQEKLRARALHDENRRGGPMMPPGCCSRFVWPTWSTSLLAHAPIVVCSRGSQQKYCVALSEKSWCGSSVCDGSTCYSYRPNGSEFI